MVVVGVLGGRMQAAKAGVWDRLDTASCGGPQAHTVGYMYVRRVGVGWRQGRVGGVVWDGGRGRGEG